MRHRTAIVDGAGLAELTARRGIEFTNVIGVALGSMLDEAIRNHPGRRHSTWRRVRFRTDNKMDEVRITPLSALATKYASLHWMPQSTVKFEPALPHYADARGRWVGGIHKYIFVLRDDDRRHVQNWCLLLPNPGIAEDLWIGRHESGVLDRQVTYVDRQQHIIVRQQLWRQIEMNTNL
jgi:hypothetical protein